MSPVGVSLQSLDERLRTAGAARSQEATARRATRHAATAHDALRAFRIETQRGGAPARLPAPEKRQQVGEGVSPATASRAATKGSN